MKSPRVESNVDDNDFQDEDIVMITRKYRRVFNKPSERRRFKDFKRENFKWEKKNETIIYFEFKNPSRVMPCFQ